MSFLSRRPACSLILAVALAPGCTSPAADEDTEGDTDDGTDGGATSASTTSGGDSTQSTSGSSSSSDGSSTTATDDSGSTQGETETGGPAVVEGCEWSNLSTPEAALVVASLGDDGTVVAGGLHGEDRDAGVSVYDPTDAGWSESTLDTNHFFNEFEIADGGPGAADVFMAWIAGGNAVGISRYDTQSESWSEPEYRTHPDVIANAPQVGVDDSGDAVVTFDGFAELWSFTYDGEQDLFTEVERIDASPEGRWVGGHDLAVSGSGDATAVWYESPGASRLIVRQRQGGTWEEPIVLDEDVGNLALNTPAVVADGDGNATVVGRSWDGQTASLFAHHYDAAEETWSGASPLSGADDDAGEPTVVGDAAGNVLVLWFDSSSGRTLQLSTYDAQAEAWDTMAMAEELTLGSRASVAMGRAGTAAVSWTGMGRSEASLFIRCHDPDVGWTETAEVAGVVSGAAQFAINGVGDIFGMWFEEDGQVTALRD